MQTCWVVLYGVLVCITVCVCVWLLFNAFALCGLLCDVVGVCCRASMLCLFCVCLYVFVFKCVCVRFVNYHVELYAMCLLFV